MSERLTPEREAEIAAAVAELDADRTLSFGTWTASPVTEKSTLPPEQAFAVEDVAKLAGATLRGSVGVFGDERHARFAAMARTAVPALLAELAAVRAERDEARKELDAYEVMNPQQCPAGKHADWLVDSEYTHACPWCQIEELKEARRLEWVAQGTTPHTPKLCACGHSHLAHTVPAPHSCFAHGQTCPCKAYRQLPHDEAVAQLERNQKAAAERARLNEEAAR